MDSQLGTHPRTPFLELGLLLIPTAVTDADLGFDTLMDPAVPDRSLVFSVGSESLVSLAFDSQLGSSAVAICISPCFDICCHTCVQEDP